MNKEKMLYTIILIIVNVVLAFIGTQAFLKHELFYIHVPELFLLILMFLTWITICIPLLMSVISEEQ